MANQPTYTDERLTNVSKAYVNADTDFISNFVFPEVLVKKPTFEVASYGKDSLRIPSNSLRTGESKAKRVTLNRGIDKYGPLSEHSLSDFVTRDDIRLSDDPFDAEADAVENIQHKMDLIDESDLATQLKDTAIITQNTTLSGTSQFNDSSSTPFQVLKTASQASTFKKFNTMFMGEEVWDELMLHAELLDRIKWSQTGVLTEQAVLALFAPFGIKNIYVGRAVANTGAEGVSDTFTSVWGKNLWLGYVTQRPGRKEVNGGYKFRLENGRESTREEFNNPPGVEVLVRDYYDHVLMNPECFYLVKDAVA